MTLEIWAAYVAAVVVLLVIPGPTVMLVVSYALSEGRRAALSTVIGVTAGDCTAMVLSLAGLGAVLAASDAMFEAVKWAGAAYLVWLGVKMWRTRPALPGEAAPRAPRSRRAMAAHAYAVTALNPKGTVFFVAFFPQFVVADAPILPQLILLGGTFLILATVNATLYVLLAGEVRRFADRPGVLRAVNRAGGTILVGAGLMTAALRRPGA